MTLQDLYKTLDPETYVMYFAPEINGFGKIKEICNELQNIEVIQIVKMELQTELKDNKLVPVMYLWFY